MAILRERTVLQPLKGTQVHEMGTKAILLQNNLPAEDWPHAEHNAMWLRNRYPLGRNIKSRDGDAIRPLVQIPTVGTVVGCATTISNISSHLALHA